ncbi:phytoene desaturase [Egibacter rhizosphaerae]|uniref:Phytoene desaturase n=1 Tax=Egibacter rhizosphaerae TaxID=1670831 RepID=A0A411YIJ5_9ACTN|nr:phytoene desaturase family protein [Egibacter rhizosphaerae]QBI21017.1 phytoene desaturase [Egibacter rhizosphaerae]
MARVVVVGAGVGGLAAAGRLAAAGHRVTVCEQHHEVGGKLGVAEREGFRFDTGPSLLTLPHLLDEALRATGAGLDDVLEREPVEPIARYRYPDGTVLDTSADPLRTAAALEEALTPGASARWQRILTRGERIWQAVEGPVLRRPLDGPGAALRLGRQLRDLPAIAPHRTLRRLGQQELGDPRLVMLLDRYATYSGSDPRRAPATLATVPYAEQAFGAWYIRGGLGRIAGALRDGAEAAGAIVRTGADVTAIEVDHTGRARGVRLADGERVPADVVVANTDAAHLYRDLLPAGVTGRTRARLARVEPSLSGFTLLLGVRGTTPGLAHHNVLFPADYDAEFDAIFGPWPRPVRDPTLYVVRTDDPAVAPAGHEAWFVLVNAPRQGAVDWAEPARVDRYAEHVLDRLAAHGFDVRSRLVFCEARSPLELARRTRADGGAIYGTSSNGPRAAFLRPSNRSPVPGLFLVGGSSHPGGGLPLVLLSSGIVADLVGPA